MGGQLKKSVILDWEEAKERWWPSNASPTSPTAATSEPSSSASCTHLVQGGQNQVPGGTRTRGGTRQDMWKPRLQLSHSSMESSASPHRHRVQLTSATTRSPTVARVARRASRRRCAGDRPCTAGLTTTRRERRLPHFATCPGSGGGGHAREGCLSAASRGLLGCLATFRRLRGLTVGKKDRMAPDATMAVRRRLVPLRRPTRMLDRPSLPPRTSTLIATSSSSRKPAKPAAAVGFGTWDG